jgi:hypothetical protein
MSENYIYCLKYAIIVLQLMAFSIQTELKLKRKNIPTKSLFLNTFKSIYSIAIHVMEIMHIQGLLYKYSVAQQVMTNHSLHNFLFSIQMTARHTAHSYPALIVWHANYSYVAPYVTFRLLTISLTLLVLPFYL